MNNSLTSRGGDDRVYTPPALAEAIVQHFNPSGWLCDPCAGKKAFSNELEKYSENVWIEEIDDTGISFLDVSLMFHMDWIITNPPWSQLRAFLKRSMEVADNVVFLCCTNALFYKARMRDIQEAGFGIAEIAMIPNVPKKPWPQSGFCLSANHLVKGWKGQTTISTIQWQEDDSWA